MSKWMYLLMGIHVEMDVLIEGDPRRNGCTYYYYLKRLAMQGWERAINTLSVRGPQPHNTSPENERRERKTAGDKKWASSYANKKASALLLKPASPTPSNTGSLRSFHRDTDHGINVRRYWEVLQRGGAWVYRCAITAPRLTRTGTYGTGRAP